jgi:hypothetical protein
MFRVRYQCNGHAWASQKSLTCGKRVPLVKVLARNERSKWRNQWEEHLLVTFWDLKVLGKEALISGYAQG